jgi:hypothetical protein
MNIVNDCGLKMMPKSYPLGFLTFIKNVCYDAFY